MRVVLLALSLVSLGGCYTSYTRSLELADVSSPDAPLDAATQDTALRDDSTPDAHVESGCDASDIPEQFRCQSLYVESWTGGCDHGFRFVFCGSGLIVAQHVDCTPHGEILTGTWSRSDEELMVSIEARDMRQDANQRVDVDCEVASGLCFWQDTYQDSRSALPLLCP